MGELGVCVYKANRIPVLSKPNIHQEKSDKNDVITNKNPTLFYKVGFAVNKLSVRVDLRNCKATCDENCSRTEA